MVGQKVCGFFVVGFFFPHHSETSGWHANNEIAKQWLQGQIRPARVFTVVKVLPDYQIKHKLIQL